MLSNGQKAQFCIYFKAAYADHEPDAMENERHRFCFEVIAKRLSAPSCNQKDFDILMAAIEADMEHRIAQKRIDHPVWWKDHTYWRRRKGQRGAPSTRMKWRAASGGLVGQVQRAIARLKAMDCNDAYIDGIAHATGCLDKGDSNYDPVGKSADKLQPMLAAMTRTLRSKRGVVEDDNIPF